MYRRIVINFCQWKLIACYEYIRTLRDNVTFILFINLFSLVSSSKSLAVVSFNCKIRKKIKQGHVIGKGNFPCTAPPKTAWSRTLGFFEVSRSDVIRNSHEAKCLLNPNWLRWRRRRRRRHDDSVNTTTTTTTTRRQHHHDDDNINTTTTMTMTTTCKLTE